jgi:hypothetical protein
LGSYFDGVTRSAHLSEHKGTCSTPRQGEHHDPKDWDNYLPSRFHLKITIIRRMASLFNVGHRILVTELWRVFFGCKQCRTNGTSWRDLNSSGYRRSVSCLSLDPLLFKFLSEKSLMPEIQFRCHQMSLKSSGWRR